jgi:hypothetical protein
MEFLIRIRDRSSGTTDSKAGDVIAARPDNWPWSQAELTNTDWVIVRSNLTQAEADAALALDIDSVTGAMKRRRKYWIDTSATGLNVSHPADNHIFVVSATTVRNFFKLKA